MLEGMRSLASAGLALVAMLAFADTASDPWPKGAVLEPATFAHELESGKPPAASGAGKSKGGRTVSR